MEITEVKVFLKEGQDKKLKAYATITLDNCFVVRNVKVIEGNKGLFVAMPSRKMKDPCPKCGFRNSVRTKFCNQCGSSLPQTEPRPIQPGDDMSRQSEHKDIAHPITAECRDYIQKKVLDAYDKEKKSPTPSAGSYKPSGQTAAPLAAPLTASLRKPAVVEEDNDIEL
ncbi:MAG: septation protein SpoVG family protein [Candidatus Omnitrophota bacterium]|nr:septation protein SpoVG family protein [Candidatus Omnitrophota bacterium]